MLLLPKVSHYDMAPHERTGIGRQNYHPTAKARTAWIEVVAHVNSMRVSATGMKLEVQLQNLPTGSQ